MGSLGTFNVTGHVPATDPQVRFLTSLTNELYDLSALITGDDVTAFRADALAALPGLSKSVASDRISSLKGEILPIMRQTVRARSYATQTVEPPVAVVELDLDGIYVVDGEYFRVKRSRTSDNLYALRLDTETRRWEYAPGIVRSITPAHRITAEIAATLPFSWCIRCGAELTREESIGRNMGPVCYSKSIG